MSSSIFSVYSTPENRVTATILAVFDKLNIPTVTRLLQIIMDDSAIELIGYENQIKGNTKTSSVPDGRISGLFDYYIETKIKSNSVKPEQLIKHCAHLKYDFSKLLVLTPDEISPECIKTMNDNRIIWCNFNRIVDGINSILQNSNLLFDREKFLLCELKEFITSQNLLPCKDYENKIVIIPAGRGAWNLYLSDSIYICQANRTFKKTKYMGFYADSEIKPFFPQILGSIECLNIHLDDLSTCEINAIDEDTRSLIRQKLEAFKKSASPNEWNQNHKYIFLTDHKNPNTHKINHCILNDKTSSTDKGTAFVQKQAYLNIDELQNIRNTSELKTY